MGFVRKKTDQAKEIASDAVSIATDIVKPVIQTVDSVVVKPVVDTVGDIYMEVRDPLQAAAVVAGNYVVPGSAIITSQLVSDDAKQMLATDIGKAAVIGSGVAGSGLLNSTDPNAVGGVTGPDNIDIGGGWSPAAGATAAELEAARLALETSPPIETLPPIEQTPTITPEVISPTPETIVDEIAKGNADKAALYSNAGYGDTMTPAQISAYDKAIAAGMTVSDALNYARVGLLVNGLVGDPLGLSGKQPSGGGGSTGFGIVPIPSDWKSPTYAAPSAPIDLNSIFSNQNMLGGTQWQGLQTQQPNVSFNDIFAAGQQQTPMGTPVDINQIVSSILGQAATSQKPA